MRWNTKSPYDAAEMTKDKARQGYALVRDHRDMAHYGVVEKLLFKFPLSTPSHSCQNHVTRHWQRGRSSGEADTRQLNELIAFGLVSKGPDKGYTIRFPEVAREYGFGNSDLRPGVYRS